MNMIFLTKELNLEKQFRVVVNGMVLIGCSNVPIKNLALDLFKNKRTAKKLFSHKY